MPEDSEPNWTPEEQDLLLKSVLNFTNPEIGSFLESHGLKKSGTKEDLRERIEQAIEAGTLIYTDLIDFLDAKAPWGKQHVFLYSGPLNEVQDWQDPDAVRRRLQRAQLGQLLDAETRVVLPERLTLTNIVADGEFFLVNAVSRRDGYFRRSELDFSSAEDDAVIEYRAYERVTVRNTVRFEWDLVRNEAMLQITQLPSGHTYEAVRDEFAELIKEVLDLNRFATLNLRNAIRALQANEEAGGQETRLRAVDYETIGGRQVSGRSGGQAASLFGERVIDDAMRALRDAGEGRIGNFYWRAQQGTPLTQDVHVYVLANAARVNITVAHPEEVIRYVVGRVRYHCR